MSVLRRLYRYLARYRGWAALAFGSMLIFALTQTVMIALAQPIFDVVLAPPTQKAVQPTHVSRESAAKEKVLNIVLKRDLPEGKRGAIINTYDRGAHRFDVWWNARPQDKARKVLMALLMVFVIRAFTSFFSEYAFQKVGLSTVRDLRNELYERLIFQSHRFFSERSTGEMVSRVVSDADAIQAAVSTRMGDLFQESITLLGLIVYVFFSNPELALIGFVIAPALVFPVVHSA
jgi:ABC-type multidrug transport system, ATPase and permease components